MNGGRIDSYHTLCSLILGLFIIISSLVGPAIIRNLAEKSAPPTAASIEPATFSELYDHPGADIDPRMFFDEVDQFHFFENRGQVEDSGILYTFHTGELSIGFKTGGYVMTICDEVGGFSMIHITFLGSVSIDPIGEGLKEHRTNRFVGNDPDNWITGISSFDSIAYHELYPGIDLIFSISEDGLKYDWIIDVGVDPSLIRESITGPDSLTTSVDDDGSLIITTPTGTITENKPFSYQIRGDVQDEVPSGFLIERENVVSYQIGEYDHTRELIIDPLIGGTFLGTSSGERISAVVTDHDDNIIVLGYSHSSNFPTTPDAYTHLSDRAEIFIAKFDPRLRKLQFSTMIGGWHNDFAPNLVVDDEGCVYVATSVMSDDFPTTSGSFQPVMNGSVSGVIFKLSSDGSELVFSTFIGGEYYASYADLVLDDDKNIIAAGTNGDIFIVRLSADGSRILDSIEFGGNMMETLNDICRDDEGNIYLTGYTTSVDYPTTDGCFQPVKKGGDQIQGQANEAYVTKVSRDLSTIIYSTFLGGNVSDAGYGIEVDLTGCAVVTGCTSSDNFPTTPGCYNDTYGNVGDAFISKLNHNGTALVYSTYISSPDAENDMGIAIAIDSRGNACIQGQTYSHNFPTTSGCFQPAFPGGGRHDLASCFVLIMDPNGSLLYSTYASGGGEDFAEGIAVDGQDSIVVIGSIRLEPTFIPTLPGCYDMMGHMNDGFILTFNPTLYPLPEITLDPLTPHLDTDHIRLTGSVQSDSSVLQYIWTVDDVEVWNGTDPECILSHLPPGIHTIRFGAINMAGFWKETDEQELIIHSRPTALILPPSATTYRDTDSIALSGAGFDDGTIEFYSWRIGSSYVNTSDPSLILSPLSAHSLPSGQHSIGFRVRDNFGIWSNETTIDLTIVTWPQAVILPFPQEIYATDESIPFRCESSDGRAITQIEWSSSIDGPLFTGAMTTINLTGLTRGQHIIELRIRDEWGFWSNASEAILIITWRPSALIKSVTPDPALTTSLVEFLGTGIDDTTVTTYHWESDIQGVLTQSPEADLTFTGLDPGTHSITLTVQDDHGYWSDPDTIKLVVTERPVAFIDSLTPDPKVTDEPLELSAHGSDDGTIIGYSWSSSIDGDLGTVSEPSVSFFNLSVGNHTISLVVCDDLGFWSEPVTTPLTVHERPEAEIYSVSPSATLVGSPITFHGQGSDDGSVTDFLWSSDRDGVLNTQAEFTASSLSRGDHTIAFMVRDDLGVWSEPVTRVLVVMSRPISVITNISHSSALLGKRVSFSGYGIDDGSITEVRWISSIAGSIGSERMFTTSSLPTGHHLITFQAKDEHGLWSEGDVRPLIIHTRPTAEIVTVLPLVPTTERVLTCVGRGFDDGEILRYQWNSSIDGELFNGSWEKAQISPLSSGTHTISLRVQDEFGIWSDEVVVEIEVREPESEQNDDSTALIFAGVLVIAGLACILAIVIRLPGSKFKP
jgi:hypothetical protein